MKKLLFVFGLVFFAGMVYTKVMAQTSSNKETGKTYYDAERTKPKEVFSFKDKQAEAGSLATSKVKHGPYFYYHENGKLKVSGNYMNDAKNGVWKYYDESGTLQKTEKYENDKLIQ